MSQLFESETMMQVRGHSEAVREVQYLVGAGVVGVDGGVIE